MISAGRFTSGKACVPPRWASVHLLGRGQWRAETGQRQAWYLAKTPVAG
jgi:hypothetical protein